MVDYEKPKSRTSMFTIFKSLVRVPLFWFNFWAISNPCYSLS